MATVTRAHAIAEAAQIYVNALARITALPDRQAAEEAYVPGGPPVDELEEKVRRLRARSALARPA